MRVLLALLLCLSVFITQSVFANELDSLEKRVSELSRKLVQISTEKSEDHHGHAHISIKNLEIHGGMDLRMMRVQGGKNTIVVHEAMTGVSAELSPWISSTVELAKHHDESFEVHKGIIELKIDDINITIGKTFIPFGIENEQEYYTHPMITRSQISQALFGEDGWNDTGVYVNQTVLDDVELSLAILNGNNEAIFQGENNNMPIVLNVKRQLNENIKAGLSAAVAKWDSLDKNQYQVVNANLVYENGPFEIIGEYFTQDKHTNSMVEASYGYYVIGAYTLPYVTKYTEALKLFVRTSFVSHQTGDITAWAIQPTVILSNDIKLRAIYETISESPTEVNNNQFIIQMAYEF